MLNPEAQVPTILVDGDACPRKLCRRLVAAALPCPLSFVGAGGMPVGLKDQLKRIKWVPVPPGWDAVDRVILSLAQPGDLVLSDDWDLKIQAFYKGASGVGFRGTVLTQERVDTFIARKGRSQPPRSYPYRQPPYTQEDARKALGAVVGLIACYSQTV